jgi:integrase
MPYIYSSEKLCRIIAATDKLPRTYSLQRATYATLFGLIASTGLRISEALNIRLSDVRRDSVLLIRRGEGGKSRLIPLHPTAMDALNAYIASRVILPAVDDHLFLSASGVRHTDGHLLRVARARVTFSRMSEAFAVQMMGFGF